jgi:hypothetical protein
MKGPHTEIIYHADGYATSWYDHQNRVFVAQTFNLNLGDQRQVAFELNEKALEKYKPSVAIFDAGQATGHHEMKDPEWMKNVAFPTYSSKGIRTIIYIPPQNPIAKVGAKSWVDLGKSFDIKFIEMSSLDAAFEYLRDNRHLLNNFQ